MDHSLSPVRESAALLSVTAIPAISQKNAHPAAAQMEADGVIVGLSITVPPKVDIVNKVDRPFVPALDCLLKWAELPTGWRQLSTNGWKVKR
jgi:hypothetical protein